MKNYILILFLSLQVVVSSAQSNETLSTDLVIRNVSLITMKSDTVILNQDVIIKDGKIASISDSKTTHHKNILVIDGNGKYMMPSLADAHVHFPKDDIEMKRVMDLYLINGVTKLRSMRGDWKHTDWRAKYNTDASVYPKLYLSAPAISRSYDFSVSQIEDYIKTSKDQGFDFVKILSIKDQTIFTQFDSISKKYNVSIGGHFPSNISDELIFNSNYNSFEHLGGLNGDSGVVDSRLQLIKKNDVFICPTLSWYNMGSGRYSYEELRKLPGMEFIPNATVEEWIDGTKKYREKLGVGAYKEEVAIELQSLDEKFQMIKRIHELGIPMLLSPDSSSKYMISGFDMVGEMELLKNADLSNYEILKMATTNFADFFKEDYGIIEVGKPADFILTSINPLVDFRALRKIEGLYFNHQFLDSEKLELMRMGLLGTAQN